MADRIRLNIPVIVEGKYDKARLAGVVDAVIIPTNGFSVFNDREKRALIRRLGVRVLEALQPAGVRPQAQQASRPRAVKAGFGQHGCLLSDSPRVAGITVLPKNAPELDGIHRVIHVGVLVKVL